MAMKRTMVYADAADLAVIKEAAAREGVSEAEMIREAIHLAALAKRTWNEPVAWAGVFDSGDAEAAERAADALEEVWDEKAAAYRAARNGPGHAA